jgi:hypothetical protein
LWTAETHLESDAGYPVILMLIRNESLVLKGGGQRQFFVSQNTPRYLTCRSSKLFKANSTLTFGNPTCSFTRRNCRKFLTDSKHDTRYDTTILRMSGPGALVIPAVKRHTATVIMAHGLGDSGAGWVSLAENWRRRQKFEEVKFIFPNAPQIPITVVSSI